MLKRAASAISSAARRVVHHGQDHQDGVGFQGAGLGHLPGVDQELLGQDRQGAGVPGAGHVGVLAGEAGRVGEHGKAGGAASA
jgi:hypothetical protein